MIDQQIKVDKKSFNDIIPSTYTIHKLYLHFIVYFVSKLIFYNIELLT